MNGDEGNAFFDGVMLVVLVIVLIFAGVMIAVINISTDCDSFGKVKLRGEIYECKKDRK